MYNGVSDAEDFDFDNDCVYSGVEGNALDAVQQGMNSTLKRREDQSRQAVLEYGSETESVDYYLNYSFSYLDEGDDLNNKSIDFDLGSVYNSYDEDEERKFSPIGSYFNDKSVSEDSLLAGDDDMNFKHDSEHMHVLPRPPSSVCMHPHRGLGRSVKSLIGWGSRRTTPVVSRISEEPSQYHRSSEYGRSAPRVSVERNEDYTWESRRISDRNSNGRRFNSETSNDYGYNLRNAPHLPRIQPSPNPCLDRSRASYGNLPASSMVSDEPTRFYRSFEDRAAPRMTEENALPSRSVIAGFTHPSPIMEEYFKYYVYSESKIAELKEELRVTKEELKVSREGNVLLMETMKFILNSNESAVSQNTEIPLKKSWDSDQSEQSQKSVNDISENRRNLSISAVLLEYDNKMNEMRVEMERMKSENQLNEEKMRMEFEEFKKEMNRNMKLMRTVETEKKSELSGHVCQLCGLEKEDEIGDECLNCCITACPPVDGFKWVNIKRADSCGWCHYSQLIPIDSTPEAVKCLMCQREGPYEDCPVAANRQLNGNEKHDLSQTDREDFDISAMFNGAMVEEGNQPLNSNINDYILGEYGSSTDISDLLLNIEETLADLEEIGKLFSTIAEERKQFALYYEEQKRKLNL